MTRPLGMASGGSVGVEVHPDFSRFGRQFKEGISRSVRGIDVEPEFRRHGDRAGRAMVDETERSTRKHGQKAMDGAGKSMGGRFKSAMIAPLALAGPAIAGAIGLAFSAGVVGKAISKASDLSETISKTRQVFGDSAASIEAWSKTSARSFGLSQNAALSAVAQFGNMFRQIGIGLPVAKEMSQGFIQLAADFGSFNNAEPAAVVEAFNAALIGEYDTLQKFVPTISAATVETEALAMSHKKTAKELTAADKALAVYSIAQKSAGASAGDFLRTSSGLANQQRILAAQWEDLQAKIGEKFLPVITKAVTWINNVGLPWLENFSAMLSSKFKSAFDDAAGAGESFGVKLMGFLEGIAPKVWAFWGHLGLAMIKWIGPQIPPMLLELGKWLLALQVWIYTEALPKLAANLLRLGKEFVLWIGPQIGPALAEGARFLGAFVGWLLSTGLPWLIKTMVTLSWELVKWIVPRIPDLIVAIIKLWGALINWLVTTAAPWVITTMAKMGSQFVSGFIDSIRSSGLYQKVEEIMRAVVSSVARVWGSVKDAVRGPINSLMQFINSALIDNLNKVTTHFGFTIGRLATFATGGFVGLQAFADGGSVRGPGTGTSDSILARLSNGEFVVNAKATANYLPLLEEINSNRYATGGLVGALSSFARGGLDRLRSAGDWIKELSTKGAEWVISQMLGPIRSAANEMFPTGLLNKAVNTVLNKVISWSKGLGTVGAGGPGVLNALNWARGQAGKPYIWGGVGPAGYDCSGFMSAIQNVIEGKFPHTRRFATGNFPAAGWVRGPGGFMIGSFRGNPGHMAGTLGGVNVESRGGDGVVIGPSARGALAAMFGGNVWHLNGYAQGGQVRKGDPPFDIFSPDGKYWLEMLRQRTFDHGGLLQPGTSIIHNGTGRPEVVLTSDQWDLVRRSVAKDAPTIVINYPPTMPVEQAIIESQRRHDLVYGE